MNTPCLGDLDGNLLDGLQFCAITYALFESVRSTPEGIERLRLRSGNTEKRLLRSCCPFVGTSKRTIVPGGTSPCAG